jgi:UDP-N-acetylmuramyl pentapeptide phosphotransferase/UDP-N-acetylglucosamine-1-phosphate transferase
MKEVSIIGAVVLLSAGFAVSWIGVELFRKWSLNRNLLDIPNERSSHSAPVPRGGGLIIVLACLIGYVIVSAVFHTHFSYGYFVGASLVAIVSWVDDLYSLAFWKRLAVHFAAAAVLVADLGVWNKLGVPFTESVLRLGPAVGALLTIVWVVWLLNAYNFMDGIDGLAALQAVVAGIGWAVVGVVLGLDGLFLFAGIFSAASAGFLFHNWPPAKIFMGDVGSAFLGFTLAAFPLLSRMEAGQDLPVLPLLAVAFVWLFIFDTLFTLFRRLLRGERVWEAHRSHVYQRMVIEGVSHRSVTLIYGTAAALLTCCTVLALIFTGNLVALSVFLLVILTAGQLYIGIRKKR